MPGPAPKPTALKKLQGNPGKRKLNAHEPTPAQAIPSCPRHITGVARREWKRLTKELHALGLLTRVDRAGLAAYCANYGRWAEAEKALAKSGLTTMTPNGFEVPSPYVGIANKALEQMHRWASQFGMTPASRTRIHIEKPEEEDPFEAFVKQQLGDVQK